MLVINVPPKEMYNESTGEFIESKGQTLVLEHSLVSLSKWESKWCKPFMSNDERTDEELLDYIRCMTITQNVNPSIYYSLTYENIQAVNAYIKAPMTATTFRDSAKGRSREIITSEIIYYWMISLGIPFECQKWHLNRLLTLINVCSIKNTPPKKMGKSEAMAQQRQLNAARRAKLHSKG